MKRILFNRLFQAANAFAVVMMALLFLSLPVTSQPFLSDLMRGALVAPPAIVFLFLIAVSWLPLYFLQGGTLPKETAPFIAFIFAALVSCLLAFFAYFPPFKGNTIISEEVSALVTLVIAAAFYLVVSTWMQSDKRILLVLRIINISGIVLILWILAQLYVIVVRGGEYWGWMVRLQYWVSVRSLLDWVFTKRVVGFAFEPSWLAHQLNVLYFPFWLAASFTGYSAFRKLGHVSVENILLAGAFIGLVASFSRIGLLAFLMMLAYLIIRAHIFGLRWLQRKLKEKPLAMRLKFDQWTPAPMLAILLLVYGLAILLLLVFLAKFDPRVESLLSLREMPKDFLSFAYEVEFGERVVYWRNGWQVFGSHPLFGVGLGNTGFFFNDNLPGLGYVSNELLEWQYAQPYVPNVKSIWPRLLSETGIIGFSLFTTWLAILWKAGRKLENHKNPILRTMGWAGTLAIIAIIFEGFSIDSFALPYIWVAAGILTASSALARQHLADG